MDYLFIVASGATIAECDEYAKYVESICLSALTILYKKKEGEITVGNDFFTEVLNNVLYNGNYMKMCPAYADDGVFTHGYISSSCVESANWWLFKYHMQKASCCDLSHCILILTGETKER